MVEAGLDGSGWRSSRLGMTTAAACGVGNGGEPVERGEDFDVVLLERVRVQLLDQQWQRDDGSDRGAGDDGIAAVRL